VIKYFYKTKSAMSKTFIMIGLFLGSIAGGYIPLLWGGSVFSISSILLSGAGALVGIWLGFRVAQRLDI
jgi:hypothetical protein